MLRRALLVFAVVMATSGDARASAVSFGPNDVPTVFFINKSDDHNRVDYGIRLNEHCAPTGDEAKDVQAVTQAIMDSHERFIREHPDQWYMFREMWPRVRNSGREASPCGASVATPAEEGGR